MTDTGAIGEKGIEELDLLRERNRQLQEALVSRIEIEQAKGILAERLGLTTDDAFALLRYAARTARMRIHELARDVRPGERAPRQITIAVARSERWRAASQRERAEALRARSAQQAEHVRRMSERLQDQKSLHAPGRDGTS